MELLFSNFWGSFTESLYDYGVAIIILVQVAFLAGMSLLQLTAKTIELKMTGDAAALTGGTTGLASATGWLDWVNSYAPALGILVSLVSAIIAALFYYLNYRVNKIRSDEEMREELRKEILESMGDNAPTS